MFPDGGCQVLFGRHLFDPSRSCVLGQSTEIDGLGSARADFVSSLRYRGDNVE